jgi:hypothetical protein
MQGSPNSFQEIPQLSSACFPFDVDLAAWPQLKSGMSLFNDLKIDVLYEAIRIKEEIQSLEHRLAHLFAGHPSSSESLQVQTAKRAMSAATRSKMAAAAKARWAARKKEAAPKVKQAGVNAGRKRISNAGQPPFKVI